MGQTSSLEQSQFTPEDILKISKISNTDPIPEGRSSPDRILNRSFDNDSFTDDESMKWYRNVHNTNQAIDFVQKLILLQSKIKEHGINLNTNPTIAFDSEFLDGGDYLDETQSLSPKLSQGVLSALKKGKKPLNQRAKAIIAQTQDAAYEAPDMFQNTKDVKFKRFSFASQKLDSSRVYRSSSTSRAIDSQKGSPLKSSSSLKNMHEPNRLNLSQRFELTDSINFDQNPPQPREFRRQTSEDNVPQFGGVDREGSGPRTDKYYDNNRRVSPIQDRKTSPIQDRGMNNSRTNVRDDMEKLQEALNRSRGNIKATKSPSNASGRKEIKIEDTIEFSPVDQYELSKRLQSSNDSDLMANFRIGSQEGRDNNQYNMYEDPRFNGSRGNKRDQLNMSRNLYEVDSGYRDEPRRENPKNSRMANFAAEDDNGVGNLKNSRRVTLKDQDNYDPENSKSQRRVNFRLDNEDEPEIYQPERGADQRERNNFEYQSPKKPIMMNQRDQYYPEHENQEYRRGPEPRDRDNYGYTNPPKYQVNDPEEFIGYPNQGNSVKPESIMYESPQGLETVRPMYANNSNKKLNAQERDNEQPAYLNQNQPFSGPRREAPPSFYASQNNTSSGPVKHPAVANKSPKNSSNPVPIIGDYLVKKNQIRGYSPIEMRSRTPSPNTSVNNISIQNMSRNKNLNKSHNNLPEYRPPVTDFEDERQMQPSSTPSGSNSFIHTEKPKQPSEGKKKSRPNNYPEDEYDPPINQNYVGHPNYPTQAKPEYYQEEIYSRPYPKQNQNTSTTYESRNPHSIDEDRNPVSMNLNLQELLNESVSRNPAYNPTYEDERKKQHPSQANHPYPQDPYYKDTAYRPKNPAYNYPQNTNAIVFHQGSSKQEVPTRKFNPQSGNPNDIMPGTNGPRYQQEPLKQQAPYKDRDLYREGYDNIGKKNKPTSQHESYIMDEPTRDNDPYYNQNYPQQDMIDKSIRQPDSNRRQEPIRDRGGYPEDYDYPQQNTSGAAHQINPQRQQNPIRNQQQPMDRSMRQPDSNRRQEPITDYPEDYDYPQQNTSGIMYQANPPRQQNPLRNQKPYEDDDNYPPQNKSRGPYKQQQQPKRNAPVYQEDYDHPQQNTNQPMRQPDPNRQQNPMRDRNSDEVDYNYPQPNTNRSMPQLDSQRAPDSRRERKTDNQGYGYPQQSLNTSMHQPDSQRQQGPGKNGDVYPDRYNDPSQNLNRSMQQSNSNRPQEFQRSRNPHEEGYIHPQQNINNPMYQIIPQKSAPNRNMDPQDYNNPPLSNRSIRQPESHRQQGPERQRDPYQDDPRDLQHNMNNPMNQLSSPRQERNPTNQTNYPPPNINRPMQQQEPYRQPTPVQDRKIYQPGFSHPQQNPAKSKPIQQPDLYPQQEPMRQVYNYPEGYNSHQNMSGPMNQPSPNKPQISIKSPQQNTNKPPQQQNPQRQKDPNGYINMYPEDFNNPQPIINGPMRQPDPFNQQDPSRNRGLYPGNLSSPKPNPVGYPYQEAPNNPTYIDKTPEKPQNREKEKRSPAPLNGPKSSGKKGEPEYQVMYIKNPIFVRIEKEPLPNDDPLNVSGNIITSNLDLQSLKNQQREEPVRRSKWEARAEPNYNSEVGMQIAMEGNYQGYPDESQSKRQPR